MEFLEERALLSQLAPPLPPSRSIAASVVPASLPVSVLNALQGSASGTYTITPSATVAGTNYSITGSGTITGVGTVQVTGVIHTGTVKGTLQISGSIKVSDAQGSFTLVVAGNSGIQPLTTTQLATALPKSVTSPPNLATSLSLYYTIGGGTGSFKSLHGTGTAGLTLEPTIPPPVTMPPTSAGGSATALGNHGGTGLATGSAAPSGIPTFLHGHFFLQFKSGPPITPIPA